MAWVVRGDLNQMITVPHAEAVEFGGFGKVTKFLLFAPLIVIEAYNIQPCENLEDIHTQSIAMSTILHSQSGNMSITTSNCRAGTTYHQS